MDRGAWWATVQGISKSWTRQQLNINNIEDSLKTDKGYPRDKQT